MFQNEKDAMKQLLTKLSQPSQSKPQKLQLITKSLVAIADLQTDADCKDGLKLIAKEVTSLGPLASQEETSLLSTAMAGIHGRQESSQ